jgi:hypothetical protein
MMAATAKRRKAVSVFPRMSTEPSIRYCRPTPD